MILNECIFFFFSRFFFLVRRENSIWVLSRKWQLLLQKVKKIKICEPSFLHKTPGFVCINCKKRLRLKVFLKSKTDIYQQKLLISKCRGRSVFANMSTTCQNGQFQPLFRNFVFCRQVFSNKFRQIPLQELLQTRVISPQKSTLQ